MNNEWFAWISANLDVEFVAPEVHQMISAYPRDYFNYFAERVSSSRHEKLRMLFPQQMQAFAEFREIKYIFSRIREYYREGLKSDNKIYTPDWGTASLEKKNNRAKKRLESSPIIEKMTDWSNEKLAGPDKITAKEIGKHYIEEGEKAGNCGQMTSVSAYMFHLLAPRTQTYYATFTNFDHATLIVGDAPPPGPISAWANLAMNYNSYVSDAWFGVCCDIRAYQTHVLAKCNKWTVEGKMIFMKDVGWVFPNDPRYLEAFLSSSVLPLQTG
jgi:hypothetical protein